MAPLRSLGERIIVLGPSNAGKSTLALALSEKLRLPVVHLDQLRHLPNTNWRERSDEEFAALHDRAIGSDRWIIEGNYSRLMPQRFQRATGAILITSNRWFRLGRYMRRTFDKPSARAGQLAGAKERMKWEMVDWILFKTPANAARYSKIIKAADVPTVECHSAKELGALYGQWGLSVPKPRKAP
ncbi:MAG: AAA family ATPase [Pseudomonadota bacterium]